MLMHERYARDGIVFPIAALTGDEVRTYRRAVERHVQCGADIRSPHLEHAWARALATHTAVVGPAEELLGGEAAVWGTLLLAKPPHSEDYVAWHQDGVYTGMDGAETISAWIALSDSTSAAGCMRVLAATHTALLPHCDGADPRNILRGGKQIEADLDGGEVLDILLRAGEMSLHHVHLIHGSGPNRSDAARIGFIVRFLRAGVAWNGPLMPVRPR